MRVIARQLCAENDRYQMAGNWRTEIYIALDELAIEALVDSDVFFLCVPVVRGSFGVLRRTMPFRLLHISIVSALLQLLRFL